MRWIVLASAYAILWLLALQILLPIGIRSGDGDLPAEFGGADPGAPHNPQIGRKFLIATVAAGAVWVIFYALVLTKVVRV